MLTLNDGRSELWQWDTGRTLTVDADCSQVHFSNKVFGRSIDVDVIDGVSIIPDILLQTDKDLNAWAFVGTAENGYTKISKTFKVNRRNKPAYYVFTPPDQTSLEEIKEKIDYLESIQDPDAIKNAVDDYLANNPIMVKETDPTVFDWAKRELFNKADLPTSIQSFVTVDGIEYYRYHAGATYGFTWNNPHPLPGAVTITARGVAQYGGTNGTRLKTIYSDGTYGPDLYIVVSGESRTVTVTTDTSKTLAKITGNYDLENWVLLDMSVMSVQAEYNRGLPVADANATGGVLADPATDADTIPARIKDGRLFVAGATDEQIAQAVSDYMADHPIEVPDSSQNVTLVEPAEDDIPKVYFAGTLPTSKGAGEVRVKIHYISKTEDFVYPATLKVQGDSSASYPKKNFTLKVYEDDTYENKKKLTFKNWGKLNKFVLKAHWIDHSHVRNVGTAKIWGKIVASRSDYDSLPEELRNSPNNGATDGFTCKVFCNGVYQGLYEWIVPKDKLFGQDSDIATHSILNSELNNQPTCAFATTSPTMNGNWSEELQDSMSADISASFANLIKFVAGATDEEFVANAETYFDVQSVIDFNIFARVFCIVDNLCRNQIFFTYDGVKWYEGVWDVDAILGLPPSVRGFFSYDTEFQTGYIAYKDFGVTNLLYQRVETLFAERFKARYAELRSGVLSVDNIIDVYEQLTDTIKTYDGLLEEDYASTTGGGKFTGIPYKTENSIQQIRNFVAQRLPYMDEAVAKIGIGEDTGGGDSEKIPCTGITLSASEMTFTGEGTQTLTATVEPENTTDPVVWAIDNASVATVRDGVVTAISNGGATITARCGEHSATCTVTVSGIDTVNIFSRVEFKTAFINGSGVEGTSENDVCCDFVDVEDYIGVPLVFDIAPDNNSSNNSNRVLFYDESQTFKSMVTQNLNSESTINCIGNEVFAFTVPSGCKYMRVSANNSVAQNIPLEALYIRRLDTNRYNTEDAQDGHYNLEDGVVTTNSGYSHTSMSVQAGEKYFIKNIYSAVFFDADGAWLGKANLKNGSFGVTVPDGCATIGWNFSNNNVNTVEIYEVADTTQIGYYAVK